MGAELRRAVTTKPNVHQTKFGDGYEHRVAIGLNSTPRQWQVSFSRPNATADAIEAFFVARGAVQSFDWVPPHGGAGKWVCRERPAHSPGACRLPSMKSSRHNQRLRFWPTSPGVASVCFAPQLKILFTPK